MPWRRRFVVTTVCDAAFDSPRTCRLLRSMPSQTKVYSLTSLRCAAAVAMCRPVPASTRPSLVRNGFDFLERGDARLHLHEARLPEVAHAFLHRLIGDVQRGTVPHDDLPHLVRDRHHLVDADAALVARSAAFVATDGSHRLPGAVELLLGE